MKIRSECMWSFVTLWAIAKTILNAKWGEVDVHDLSWHNNDDGSVSFDGQARREWRVWPEMYKRPHQVRLHSDGPCLDALDPAPRVANRSRPGVKVSGPTIRAAPAVVGGMPYDSSESESGADSEKNDDDDLGGPDGPHHEAPAVTVAQPAARVATVAPAAPAAPDAPAHPEPRQELDAAPSASESVAGARDSQHERARAGDRAYAWGPFKIAKVFNCGKQHGWGLTCGRHTDPTQSVYKKQTPCQICITYGDGSREPPLTDQECILRLKRWALVPWTS